MGCEAGPGVLGVFLRDSLRCLVVLSRDGELAVALRETLQPSMALVRDARPEECAAVLAACGPWPWMVVSDLLEAPAQLRRQLTERPSLVLWLGPLPPGLPAHARSAGRFRDVVAAVQEALSARVDGLQLAPGSGVQAGGRCMRSAALEALVAAHPGGFDLPLRSFRGASRCLDVLASPLRPQRDRRTGRVVLAAALATAGERLP